MKKKKKPYGYDESIESCNYCYEQIENRVKELNPKNCKDILRRITTPIYKEIPIDRIANILIDTCYMQRLRRISQLSFNNLLLPSANHNRFEHSLGTYYLACRICENEFFKALTEIEKITFKIAALLHDIGHGPFSHLSDVLFKILSPGKKYSHETRARNIIWHDISNGQPACMKEILSGIFKKIYLCKEKNGMSNKQFLRSISTAIMGTDPGDKLDTKGISLLLNGPIDIDKLDYMIRDAYYTGVPFGAAADVERICNNLETKRNTDNHSDKKDNRKIMLSLKDIAPVFNLFSSRFSAYISFLYHPIPLIAQEMLLRELEKFFSGLGEDEKWKYFSYDEKTFISKISAADKKIKETIFEIENRLLFKKVFCFSPRDGELGDFKKRRDEEKSIAQNINNKISEREILIIFSPEVKFYPEDKDKLNNLDIKVVDKGLAIKGVSFFKTAIDIKKPSEVMICCRNNIISEVVKCCEEKFRSEEITYKR